MHYRLGVYLGLFVASSFSSAALAIGEVPRTITLDGRLYSNPSLGTPLIDATASLKIDVLNPAKDCVLYTETKPVDTSMTDGYFNVSIGAPTMVSGFYNSRVVAPGSPGCAPGYTPSAGDKRFIRVTVTPTAGSPEVLTPDLSVESVPSAFVAESVQGLDRSKLLELGTNAQLTQANIENVFSVANYPKLTSLLGGSATDYVRTGANGSAVAPSLAGNAATPTAGQFWYDTSANVLKYYDGTTVQTLGGAVAATTSGTIGGTTVVNTSGNITTSGTLSGNQISALSVTLYDSDRTNSIMLQTPATGTLTSNYVLTLPADDGASGEVLSTNGSGVLSWVAAASGLPTGTNGQFLRNTSGTWGAARIGIADIKSTLGMNPAVFPAACTTSQTLRYDVMTDTFVCSDINLAGAVAGNGILPVTNGGTGTADGSITGTSALTFTAGGTNQNVTLAPSGTGSTILGGKVGIGTSAPNAELSFGSGAARTILVERAPANLPGNSLTVRAGNSGAGSTDQVGGDLFLSSGHSAGAAGSSIFFQTATPSATGTTSNTASTKMIINPEGRVGIGTTIASGNVDIVVPDTPTNGWGIFRITDGSSGSFTISDNNGTAGQFSPLIEGHPSGNSRSTTFSSSITVAQDNSTTPAMVISSERVGGGALTSRPVLEVRNASTPLMHVTTGGNVGIGTVQPTVKLEVNGGAVVSRTNVIATGATVNLTLGNTHLLRSPGGNIITLQNPLDGGSYTVVVADTATSRTYSFAGCSNHYFSPTNGPTTLGSRTTYTILVVNDGVTTDCYISWVTGFM